MSQNTTQEEPTGQNCCCPPRKEPEPACCPPKEKQSNGCSPPQTATESSCCAPAVEPDSTCCPPNPETMRRQWEQPGYRVCSFVEGWLDTPVGKVPQVDSRPTGQDIFGRWQMRWGIGRDRYRIAPGLYAIGLPDKQSPVIVTANYKLTFDIVRKDLTGRHLWLLVLETNGINVWCAAGKGSFGSDELIHRIKECRLDQVVDHRRLIVPQLGAVGVAAHKVSQGCGFRTIFGPVSSADLPYFMDHGLEATPAMRRVRFNSIDRLVLTPVEITNLWKVSLWTVLGLLLLGGIGPTIFSFSAMLQRGGAALGCYLLAILAGAVITPLLLPWLPGRSFALKGAEVGGAIALLIGFTTGPQIGAANTMALFLALPAFSSWLGMNFTGSSTYTSPSGVEKEMRLAIPIQATALVSAMISWLVGAF